MKLPNAAHFVLLRGLSREVGHWLGFVSALEKQSFCLSVTCIDMPGVGEFHKEKSPASIEKLAAHIIERLPHDTTHPRFLIGLSLGGMVAIECLIQKKDYFDHFVLINSSLASLSPLKHRLKPKLKVLSLFLQPKLDVRESTILALTSKMHAADINVRDQLVAIQKARPVKRKTVIRQIIAGAKYRPDLSQIKIPGLILCSKHDALVDSACSEALSNALGAKLEVNPTAGHDLPLDDPDWIMTALHSYLADD